MSSKTHKHSHHEHSHEHNHNDSCSCGHDHKHNDSYSCGHDHKHNDSCSCGHDHKHNDSCSCGHDHKHNDSCSCGHEHEHNDSCSCGHEHEHNDSCSCGHHIYEETQLDYAAAGENASNYVYILENLGCANCAAKMEAKINALPEVTSAAITFATKKLYITGNHPEKLLPQIQHICSSIESQVNVIPENETASSIDKKHSLGTSLSKHLDLVEISIGSILFIAGLLLHDSNVNHLVLLSIYIISYLTLGRHILLEAARKLLRGHMLDENFLMSIATIGAFAIGEYPEALGIMLFYRIGEFFEQTAVERSRKQIMEAVDLRPDVVSRAVHDTIEIIPADMANVGDILIIRPGDRIPLDGIVIDGNSRIDTSPITGEPVPVSVTVGSTVISGCMNTSGQLKIRVQKVLGESMVSKILDSVEHAAANKPQIDRFITRFAKIYTPFVVGTALLTAIVPSLITGEWMHWVYTALTFLVISCPCALVLSVPLAFFSGIGAGSKKGILFKGGLSIEALSKIKAVVMDKTGTITQGNFKLQKIVAATNNFSEEELLHICASCEQYSSHPIANSIVTAAKEKHLELSEPSAMEELAGHGIVATLEGKQILCGNQKLMKHYQVAIDNISEKTYGAEVFLAIDGTFAGYFLISDTIKDDAASAIKRLKRQNLHTAMLTGDSEDSASVVAANVGVDETYAKLLPQDKLEILTKIRKKHGAVMFIGDGINDAPVLAGADVGAAMGSGADAAIEAADTVFMNSNMNAIPEAIAIAKQTNMIANQNVTFALAVKLLVMILGLLGFANMWMAVFADTGVAMICVVNSVRILYTKKH